MPFVDLPDGRGKLYVPEKKSVPGKKNVCPDCFACQQCGSDRCEKCRKCRKCRREKLITPETATTETAPKAHDHE